MCYKLFAAVFIILAFGMGVLAVLMPAAPQPYVAMLMKFFEVSIPVLAVGALLKYICCCGSHKKCCTKGKCCCNNEKCGTEKTECNK